MKTTVRIYVIILASTLMTSCNNSQEFVLINKSTSEIKDVKISTSSKSSQSKIFVIGPMDSVKILNMKNEPKQDGHFYIDFNGKSMGFGYYTNGAGLSDLYRIIFFNESIYIKEINEAN